jgi:hypothetical protein
MFGQIVAVTSLVLGSLAGHFVVRRASGPDSNVLLQWIGGVIGATCVVIFLLVIALAIDPPDVFDPEMVFAQLAPIVGAISAAVEFVLLVSAGFGKARYGGKAVIQMGIMFGIGCLCISWLVWYESELNRRWKSPPPAPVPMRSSDNQMS